MTGTASLRRHGRSRFLTQRAGLVSLFLLVLALPFAAFAKIGIEHQMLLGNPSGATTNGSNHVHYLHQRAQFVMDYNDTLHAPNWVSWNFTTGDRGSAQRKDNFIGDDLLPAGFVIVQGNAFSGSGYDRGHMCPSADRTITQADNDATFYMSNMVMQHPDNNQGVWANFENYTRTLATTSDTEVLIICGPGGFTGATYGSTNVAIPAYTWKIVVVVPPGAGNTIDRIDANTRVIALEVPNIAMSRSVPWQDFLTSPAQIEADTGFTFFTALPAPVQGALRAKIDGQVSGFPVITDQPDNQIVNVSTPASFTVAASGTAPLAYQWYKGENLLTGETNTTFSIASVQPSDVGSYSVVVSNSLGSVESNTATLSLIGSPQISTHPQSKEVLAGTNATFTVVATGNATLTYQWYKDDVALGGEITDSLTVSDVQSDDLGSYNVVVTNSIGSIASNYATLGFATAPVITTQPLPQSVFTGGTTTFTVAASGTAPLAYQWYKGVNAIGGATSATYSISNTQLTDAGNFHAVVTNLAGFATSNTVALTVTEAPPTSDIYWNFSTTGAVTSGLPASLVGGTVAQGNNNNSGSNPALIQTNSVSSGYTGASGGGNATIAARTGALSKAAGGSAYFEFTLTPSPGKQFVATGLKFGSRSTGTGPQAYSVFTSLDGYTTQIAGGALPNNSAWVLYTPSIGTFTAPVDTAVTFRIYAYNGAGGAVAGTANWRIDDMTLTAGATSPAVAPSITTHPVSQDVFVDGSITLTVAASGTAPFTYQWRKGGVNLDGATGASLLIDPVSFATAGNYDVVVTNSVNSATSNAATLTVYQTFANWASHAGLTPPNDGLFADFDGDGVANVLEYGLNRSATVAETTGLPTLTIEGGQLVFRYTKPKWVTGLTYQVQVSSDAAAWSNLTATIESSTATTETWIATQPLGPTRQFFHLNITP